jgi:hypothetical protein
MVGSAATGTVLTGFTAVEYIAVSGALLAAKKYTTTAAALPAAIAHLRASVLGLVPYILDA